MLYQCLPERRWHPLKGVNSAALVTLPQYKEGISVPAEEYTHHR